MRTIVFRQMGDPLRERHLRARRAVLSAIHGLRRAHQYLDDSPVELKTIAAMIRRWIEGQTFSPRAGSSGVQLIDAQAARYGEFDEVFLVGLVEGEWPQRAVEEHLLSGIAAESARLARLAHAAGRRARGISRLDGAGPPPGAPFDVRAGERLDSSARACFWRTPIGSVSAPRCCRSQARSRMFVHEALAIDPVEPSAVEGEASAWLGLRTARSEAAADRFHGAAAAYKPAAYSVSSLERYLQCPFRFFSERVLGLQEDPEDEATLNPKELGIFVHEVFQKFFEEWNRRGHRGITPENLPQARADFRRDDRAAAGEAARRRSGGAAHAASRIGRR